MFNFQVSPDHCVRSGDINSSGPTPLWMALLGGLPAPVCTMLIPPWHRTVGVKYLNHGKSLQFPSPCCMTQ